MDKKLKITCYVGLGLLGLAAFTFANCANILEFSNANYEQKHEDYEMNI